MALEEDRALSSSEYWDSRYSSSGDGQLHEWFRSFENLEPFFQDNFFNVQGMTAEDDPLVLHLGSGDSVGAWLFTLWLTATI